VSHGYDVVLSNSRGPETLRGLIEHLGPGAHAATAAEAAAGDVVVVSRRALPMAGDDEPSKKVVADLIDQFGFDVVDVGGLAEGRRFQRGKPAYVTRYDTCGLLAALAAPTQPTAPTRTRNGPLTGLPGPSGITLVCSVSRSITRTWRLGSEIQPSWGHPDEATTTPASVSR
jgi:hypothetical protein